MWWLLNLLWNKIEIRQEIKNRVPIKTCKPWNPVTKKNILPQRESLNLNLQSIYSSSCRKEKYIPSKIVIIIPCTLSSHFPTKIEWWPQVREIPLLNKTTVFNKGTENADKGVMHIGGQTPPVSNLFLNEKEKNLQKKEKKKRISLVINHPIDHLREHSASLVWLPKLLSLLTSFSQKKNKEKRIRKFNITDIVVVSFQQKKTKDINNLKTEKEK